MQAHLSNFKDLARTSLIRSHVRMALHRYTGVSVPEHGRGWYPNKTGVSVSIFCLFVQILRDPSV